MTDEQLTAFLASDVLCRLGCLDDEGFPYVVPTWFQYEDGGFYIVPRKRSKWAHFMQQDDRVSLCLDRESGDRVLVKGRARVVEDPNVGGRWVEIARKMVILYSGEAGLPYLNATLEEPRWLFFVQPEKITSWPGGDWAQRYKAIAEKEMYAQHSGNRPRVHTQSKPYVAYSRNAYLRHVYLKFWTSLSTWSDR